MAKELKRNDILWKMTMLLYFAMENYLFIEKQHINIMYKSISGPFSWAKLPESSSYYIYSLPLIRNDEGVKFSRTQLAIDSHGNAGSCPIWALAKSIRQKPMEISSKVQNPTETTILNQHLTILILKLGPISDPNFFEWQRLLGVWLRIRTKSQSLGTVFLGGMEWHGLIQAAQLPGAFLGTWWEHRSEHVPCITWGHLHPCKNGETFYDTEGGTWI